MSNADSKSTDTDHQAAGGDKPADMAPSSRSTIEVNDERAVSCYANFCRVTGTPEELILDLGLNSRPHGSPTEPIKIKQRVIVNYFTAKRILNALAMSVQRQEQAFGVLETDVQKRVTTKGRPAKAGAGG